MAKNGKTQIQRQAQILKPFIPPKPSTFPINKTPKKQTNKPTNTTTLTQSHDNSKLTGHKNLQKLTPVTTMPFPNIFIKQQQQQEQQPHQLNFHQALTNCTSFLQNISSNLTTHFNNTTHSHYNNSKHTNTKTSKTNTTMTSPIIPIKQQQQQEQQPQQFFQQALSNCTSFLQNIQSNVTSHFNSHLSNFAHINSHNNNNNNNNTQQLFPSKPKKVSSNQVIQERLAGVPVYTLTNSNEEFVLVSDKKGSKSLGLFCFGENDAREILNEMKSLNSDMLPGSKVVPVALNKLFQIKVDGVSFRLIPETAQVKNATREMEKLGKLNKEIPAFPGVPVFQSQSLVLRSQDKRYRPVFFRKEDLENSLVRASQDQGKRNPLLRGEDIQVAVLEDIIKGMKDESSSTWDDVVFIPPGFDVSTNQSQSRAS